MNDLKRALSLCGIQPGETFSVAAIKDREIRAECFTSPDAAETFLDGFDGWNLYLCGNPFKPGTKGKPSASDVLEGRVLLIDADPSGAESSPLDAIRELAASLNGRAHVIDSGRGAQAWLRVSGLNLEQRRQLARGLASKFARSSVKFDGTHNLDRLMRLPGSTNTKTGRTASIVSESTGEPLTVADLASFPEPIEPAAPVKATFDCGEPSKADLALVMGEAKKLWDTPASQGERSKRDFLFVLTLIRSGVPEQAICRLLWAMPHSKAREDGRNEDYWKSTLASVHAHIAEGVRMRALAKSLPDSTDEGAAFEPAALDALLFVRAEDGPAEWARLRARLKKAKIGIRDLEDAMAQRAAGDLAGKTPPLRYVAQGSKRIGWFKQTSDGTWTAIETSDSRSVLRAYGADVDTSVNKATDDPWVFVNEPFQPEELEGRRWNRDGARLAFEPDPSISHPTWDLILGNVGRNLDGAVQADEWCKLNGLKTGADYLRVWISCMIRWPKERLAYLFFHGEQQAGKSLFHEALSLLFARGYVRANNAIQSPEFNGELAGAVLCVIEEIDLSDSRKRTHERVKDWVTGKTMLIRALYCQSYVVENATHWVQCANKLSYMPILPGDTRITAIWVQKVAAEDEIPKEDLLSKLLSEAPGFIATVSAMARPKVIGRLTVPAIETADKKEQADASRTELESWLETANWLTMTEAQLVGGFLDSLAPSERASWDRARILRELPGPVRRERRLIGALERLAPFDGTTSELLNCLPPDVRKDFGSTVALGRALSRIGSKWDRLLPLKTERANGWRISQPLSESVCVS